jgi:hypothetical protein
MESLSPVAFSKTGESSSSAGVSATEASTLSSAARAVLLGETHPNTAVMPAHKTNEILYMVFSYLLDWQAHIEFKLALLSITRSVENHANHC